MTKAQSIKELRKKVAFSCRILGFRGVTQGSFGHVSVRIPGTDRILIKSKGPDEAALQFATEKDIITIDINGKVIEAAKGLDAPHETDMHLAVFKEREDVQSVIHTHPDWVVALTASEKPLLPIFADVHVSTSVDHLERMLRDGRAAADNFRVYSGYAGWSAGQLDAEIARDDWYVVDPDTAFVFDADPEKAWRQLLPRDPTRMTKKGSSVEKGVKSWHDEKGASRSGFFQG